MLKKLLLKLLEKKQITEMQQDLVFPNAKGQETATGSVGTNNNQNAIVKNINVENLITLLVNDSNFITLLAEIMSNKILTLLEAQYNFQPSAKYKEEAAQKQQYLTQLDTYLQERKQLKQTIDTELSQFLNQTSANFSKALDSFNQLINQRIADAEVKYGVDIVRDAILTENTITNTTKNNNTDATLIANYTKS